jgi:hypothetical protein
MQLTNKHGLSQAWMNAVKADDEAYDKVGWRSVTNLISPVRASILRERHDEEVVEDVSDRIWALLGSACHYVLEKAADEDSLTEQRFTIEVLGKEISLKPDRVEVIPNTDPAEYHLKDLKITSVWSVILDTKIEWVTQTNIYAYALRTIGINVTRISMEVLMKDWQHKEAIRDKTYPQDKVAVVPIEVWTDEAVKELLEKRVRAFLEAEEMGDADLPECTEQERWARPDKFAITKKGAKRATKVCASRPEAERYMEDKGYTESTHEIVFRAGTSVRCEKYCSAKPFCNQYHENVNPEF